MNKSQIALVTPRIATVFGESIYAYTGAGTFGLQYGCNLLDSCYVFFIGPKSRLYYSKYAINTGEIQISSVTDLEFVPTWAGIGGSNQDQVFLYLKKENNQLIEVHFDTKNDTTTTSDTLFVIAFSFHD